MSILHSKIAGRESFTGAQGVTHAREMSRTSLPPLPVSDQLSSRIKTNPFPKWSPQSYRNIDYIQNLLPRHQCPNCHRSYKHRSHMMRHYRYECGILQRFQCPYCKHHLRQRTHVWTHIRTFHPDRELYCIDIATNARLSWQEHRSD
ncbi:PREDICTED: zinc finger protein 524-like [Vollenhovia emeryi]|uniref:zinc finger protein 524-like n=1 Tax=Vollenhovia emeryi TaxID=411798 RepID=UPI0005F56818|nr:PREDICTED: zinc finger protein 524-like [Vollenhovia emeryi]